MYYVYNGVTMSIDELRYACPHVSIANPPEPEILAFIGAVPVPIDPAPTEGAE